MKQLLETLRKCRFEVLKEANNSVTAGTGEHNTPEQTRKMIIQSIFSASLTSLDNAIKQLEILERELY